jgi:hypothetical protein
MKEKQLMKAPEKIWVHELSAKELNIPFKEYHVEYTRTDAFIKKACDWMSNHLQNEYGGFSDFIKAFKKAMKG